MTWRAWKTNPRTHTDALWSSPQLRRMSESTAQTEVMRRRRTRESRDRGTGRQAGGQVVVRWGGRQVGYRPAMSPRRDATLPPFLQPRPRTPLPVDSCCALTVVLPSCRAFPPLLSRSAGSVHPLWTTDGGRTPRFWCAPRKKEGAETDSGRPRHIRHPRAVSRSRRTLISGI